MQVRTVSGLKDAVMDSYRLDCCMYGQLLYRIMEVWTFNG